jgi:hypothetical protein
MSKFDQMSLDLMIAKKRADMEFIGKAEHAVAHAAHDLADVAEHVNWQAVGNDVQQVAEGAGEVGAAEAGDGEGAVVAIFDGVVRSTLRPSVSIDELITLREKRAARKS